VSRWLTALLVFGLAGCARRVPGQVEGRGFHYDDEAGLTVLTVGAQGTQQIVPGVEVSAVLLADHVENVPPPKAMPKPPGPGQPSGHFHEGVDVISSASVVAGDGAVKTDKWRFEGTAGVNVDTGPVELRASVRGSTEPDYRSLSGRIEARSELFERNTTVIAFVGAGHDLLQPMQAPPGQDALWPAHHERWSIGGSVLQLLTPSLTVSGGVGFTHQLGTLESPYRRAIVRTTLFPEALPDTRLRATAFLGASYFVGGGTAIHFRQGAYVDSWGVWSLVPEGSVVKEVGERWLVSIRYRFYAQNPAAFYQPTYRELSSLMSGDPRLGQLREHQGGAEVRWTPWGRMGWTRSLTFAVGYELSVLSYPDLRSSVRSQVFSAGATWGY
jgi:hypothetical protein